MEGNEMKIYRREANLIRGVAKVLPNKVNGTNVTLSRTNSKMIFSIKRSLETIARILDKIE
jgi:hypothetical protein